jgi:hypothetical protein
MEEHRDGIKRSTIENGRREISTAYAQGVEHEKIAKDMHVVQTHLGCYDGEDVAMNAFDLINKSSVLAGGG